MTRGWVLRVWFVLTALVALVALLDHTDPPFAHYTGRDNVVTAFLHPVASSASNIGIVRELLKHYIAVWVTFVVLLTAGTVTSELGVVADSVLSRGVSRWQYFLGKLSARLAAVLAVYALVMVPTTLVLWLEAPPSTSPLGDPDVVASAVGANGFLTAEPNTFPSPAPAGDAGPLTFAGACFALARVAVLLVVVVTGSIAFSAGFTSSVLSIAVSWMTVYGGGLLLSLLDVRHVSPASLLRELPDLLAGNYSATQQFTILGGWLAAAAVLALASGSVFARRDV